jgi:hypothetical protein
MSDLTRRRFLSQTSIGLGAVGVAAAVPNLARALPGSGSARAIDTPARPLPVAPLPDLTLVGPVLVHVRDAATGEVGVLLGDREHVYRDPGLVTRLVEAVRQATEVEG